MRSLRFRHSILGLAICVGATLGAQDDARSPAASTTNLGLAETCSGFVHHEESRGVVFLPEVAVEGLVCAAMEYDAFARRGLFRDVGRLAEALHALPDQQRELVRAFRAVQRWHEVSSRLWREKSPTDDGVLSRLVRVVSADGDERVGRELLRAVRSWPVRSLRAQPENRERESLGRHWPLAGPDALPTCFAGGRREQWEDLIAVSEVLLGVGRVLDDLYGKGHVGLTEVGESDRRIVRYLGSRVASIQAGCRIGATSAGDEGARQVAREDWRTLRLFAADCSWLFWHRRGAPLLPTVTHTVTIDGVRCDVCSWQAN